MTKINNLLQNINKSIESYLDAKKIFFTNKNIMDDNRLNNLKKLIDDLVIEKYEVNDNSPVYLISKDWVYNVKLFIEPFIESRKENMENLILTDTFDLEKVYSYFMGKKEKIKLKNYFGVIFPGPINNYTLLDFKDHWIDPENLEENNIIKNDLKINRDYFYLTQKDWSFLKEIFSATNEIKRKKKDVELYKIKIVIFDHRLSLNENKNLLRKRVIQIDSDSSIKNFKNKIIRCLNYEIMQKEFKLDEELYNKNDILFYLLNKKNKNILIEMILSLVNKNKMYESLYLQQIKKDNNESIKNLINYYDKDEYLLIAEIVSEKYKNNYFIRPIFPEIDNSNIYNCSMCGEQLNLDEKYKCNLCNLSLFCSKECSEVSGEHINLHKSLYEIYNKKFELEVFLNEKIKTKKGDTKGIVGLEKDKYYSTINCILQCLSNSIDLTKYFLNKLHEIDINVSDYLNKNETFSVKYYNLIKEMWLSNEKTKNLEACHIEFLRLLIKELKIDTNDNSSVNDIHKIINFLFKSFHKELNRYAYIEKANKNNPNNNEGVGIENPFKKKDNSIISDLFQGIYESSCSCSKCGNISMVYDIFNIILLPIPKKNNNLIIKYFNEFECKYMRFTMDDDSTIKSLKDKAMKNISDKINHLVHIMSLTELIEVTAFGTDVDDEKILTYTTIYNNIELVQFDKNKILTKVYITRAEPFDLNKDKNNNKKIGKSDLNLQLNKIYKDNRENNDIELVFYEKSIVDEKCINIYVYPFVYDEKEKSNKYKDKMFNSYPIAISVKKSLILENFEYLVNVKLRDLLIDHFKNESEKGKNNYIKLVFPHYFCNSPFYPDTNCFLCNDKRKNSLFCNLFDNIDKNKTIKDLLKIFKYPEQPIIFLAKCKYYDLKKQFYSNISPFHMENNKKVFENKLDIYDCFELYTKKNIYEDMIWPCESCNSMESPQKQILIYKPPLYLILQLDRILYKKGGNFNNVVDDNLITFPINNLDLTEYVEGPEKNKAIYNLYAAIYKESSNIYAICKNNKKWINYKDNKVFGTNQIVNKNVHFLFYRRTDLPDQSLY